MPSAMIHPDFARSGSSSVAALRDVDVFVVLDMVATPANCPRTPA
jgi:hypothetical protein